MIEVKAWTLAEGEQRTKLTLDGTANEIAIELSAIIAAVLLQLPTNREFNIEATAQNITEAAVEAAVEQIKNKKGGADNGGNGM